MQVYNQAQDENPSLGAPGKMPGLLGKHLQPKTARKALGNITNTSRAAEPGQDKTPAAGLKTSRKSKALGDITNVGRTGTKAQPATKQLGSRKLAARPLQEVQPAAEPESPLFDEPIEALAGKGWRQLAAEAEEREDREMAARVKDFWRPARVHHWPYSVQVPVSDMGHKASSQALQPSMSPRLPVVDLAQLSGPVQLPDISEPDWTLDFISDDETGCETVSEHSFQQLAVSAAG